MERIVVSAGQYQIGMHRIAHIDLLNNPPVHRECNHCFRDSIHDKMRNYVSLKDMRKLFLLHDLEV